jgi:excisionase family DNA binding protein
VPDRLLTAEDVAELLQLRTDRVYALARAGEIPHLRFGRTLRFRREAIERWLGQAERGKGKHRAEDYG